MKSITASSGESQPAVGTVDDSADYVLVEQPDETRDDFTDDDSYDHCDDVYSLASSGDEDEEENRTTSDGEEGPTKEVQVQMLFSSVLMRDLDEAHAAAALAGVPDLQHLDDSDDSSKDENHTRQETPASPKQKRISSATKKLVAPLSRTSNKKRRKKLKLMKKAQAAANAAQALEERNKKLVDSDSINGTTLDSRRKASKSITHKPKGSRNRPPKKVNNIAVACATETLAAYRQECNRTKQPCA